MTTVPNPRLLHLGTRLSRDARRALQRCAGDLIQLATTKFSFHGSQLIQSSGDAVESYTSPPSMLLIGFATLEQHQQCWW